MLFSTRQRMLVSASATSCFSARSYGQKHSVLILVKPRHLACALLELLKQFVRKFLLFRWKFLQKSIVHFQHRNFCRYPALPVFQHRTLIRCKQLCRCILIDQQIIAQAVIRLLRQLLAPPPALLPACPPAPTAAAQPQKPRMHRRQPEPDTAALR